MRVYTVESARCRARRAEYAARQSAALLQTNYRFAGPVLQCTLSERQDKNRRNYNCRVKLISISSIGPYIKVNMFFSSILIDGETVT